MPTMMRRAAAHGLAGLIALASAVVAAQTTTAEHCRRQYPNERAAQLTCARKAHAPATPAAQQAQPAQQPPPLVSPLANAQLVFGFFDRRFPGFNNGLEHLGVDFTAAAGTAVGAVCDGTVVSNNTSQADTVSAVIVVEHECPQPLGRIYGYYGHVQSVLLSGESVSAGGSIGTVREWPGNAHLHLGLSTRLQEDNWGVAPRSATLPELEAQGWLNPLDFLAGIPPRPAANSVARPPPARVHIPKVRGPAAKSMVKRKP
jgi:murein DD-endopeptidase MepM/ murein hydrolase activator NlpD